MRSRSPKSSAAPAKPQGSPHRTIKLVIGFAGTRFEGWQDQRKGRTLQELFERILEKILKEKTPLVSSSRTDSGVHAAGLVAHFKTSSRHPVDVLRNALNFHLPKDVLVLSASDMPADFHARFDAVSKRYCYRIWTGPLRPLFEAPYVLWYPYELDLSRMRRAARALVGRHDFSAFRDHGSEDDRDPVRSMKRICVTRKGSLIEIELEANGFLRHMCRIIAGTLIEVGRGKIGPETVARILASKDRKQAGPTARSQGLILLEVKYLPSKGKRRSKRPH